MGMSYEVECPNCHGQFIVSPSLLETPEFDFHCPFCDINFPQSEAVKIRK